MERDAKEVFQNQSARKADRAQEDNSSAAYIKANVGARSNRETDTVADKSAPGDGYLSGLKLAFVITAVTMAAALMILDLSVVVTATPEITTHFHSTADIGWYGSAYLLTNCAVQPLSGKIYAHFSTKMVFLAFLFLFELGSLICGISTSSDILIVGRAVAGMGGAGLVNGALTILANSVPLERRAFMMGILMGCANIANVLGPLIGGSLTQYVTWRWCFYINLPCGAFVAAVLLVIHIPEGFKPKERLRTVGRIFNTLDMIGFVTFAPAIVMFLLALSWGGTAGHPWNSATIIGLFVGCVPIFAIFFAWEHHRGDTALLPLSMFRRRVVAAATIVQFFIMGAVMLTIYYMPLWFQAVQGRTPTIAGAFLLPMIGAQIITSVVGGFLISKIGYYTPFGLVGLALSTIGSGLLTLLLPNSSTGDWVGFQLLSGMRGLALQVPLLAVQSSLPKEQVAVGNSMIVFMQNFGGTLILSFGELIFTQVLGNKMRIYAPEINTADIISWGATGFRDHVARDSLYGVLLAYDRAITTTLYLSVGCMAMAWGFTWGLGWKSVKKPKQENKQEIAEKSAVAEEV